MGLTLFVPLVVSMPVQPSLAVQEVALVLDHVRVELLPDAMVVGLSDRVTVGAGAVAVTVTVALAGDVVPPAPVHVRV